jgi:hypothetical protein
MKMPLLLAAVALTCGTAFAQSEAANNVSSGTAVESPAPSGNSLADKTRRAGHRVADATRRTGHRLGDAMNGHHHKDGDRHARADDREHHARAGRDDSRRMGANRDMDDHSRQARMDDAYANWQKKQK